MAINWYCRECKQMYSFDEPLKQPLLCPQGHTVFVVEPIVLANPPAPKNLPNLGGYEPIIWQRNMSRPAVGPMAHRPPAIENLIPEDSPIQRLHRDQLEVKNESVKDLFPILPERDSALEKIERQEREREKLESIFERRERLIAAGRSPSCTCSAVTFTEFVNPLKSGVLAGGHDVTTTAFFKCRACSDLDIERARQRDREGAAQIQALSRRAGRVLGACFLTLVVCVLVLGSLWWFLLPEGTPLLVTIPLGVLVFVASIIVAAFSTGSFWRWLK